ncbi:hypothetical protein M2351_003836 [Azospirillum canadense]|nr:hypothetical protein [Azospirillum canadense]MCW2239206.1 hypothetical protein [Azospirillum canadense]
MDADELTGSRLLQLAAAKPFAQQGSLIFGDRSLDLQEKLIAGVIGDGVIEKGHRTAHTAELLQEQHLVGVAAGQTVRSQHRDDLHLTIAHRIAQGIQPRPVEPGTAVAFVAKHMAVIQVVAVGVGPRAQSGELAFDGLLAFLAFGGDAGVDGSAHG